MAVSQILWLHYSVALVLPLIGILAYAVRRSAWKPAAFALGALALLLVRIDFTTTAAPSPVTVLHVVLWAAVLAATALLRVPAEVDYRLARTP